MTNSPNFGFPEAAARLGVSLRVLRQAIRAGKIPAPAVNTATAALTADWLDSAKATIQSNPTALRQNFAQKVPPFARYPGTSAWRKYHVRARAYAQFQSAQ